MEDPITFLGFITQLVSSASLPIFSGVRVTRSLVLCVWFVDRCLLLCTFSVFSGVRVTRSLVLCVWFVDRCLSFCTFSFGHCVLWSSSIYGFRLPL